MDAARDASLLTWVWVIAMWLVMLAVLAAIALLVRAAWRGGPLRIPPAFVAVFLFVLIGGCMTMCVTAPCNSYEMYIPAIRDNGGRVVAALERYVIENGSPPEHLGVLVPKYIAEIPPSGYPSQERFRYLHGRGTDFGNPANPEDVVYWRLSVDCSCPWERFGSTYDEISADSRESHESQWSPPRRGP